MRRDTVVVWYAGRRILGMAPPTGPRQSVNRPAKREKRYRWTTRRLVEVEASLVRERKCRWPEKQLQARPRLA